MQHTFSTTQIADVVLFVLLVQFPFFWIILKPEHQRRGNII